MKRIIFSLWFIVYGLLPFVYAQDETLTLLTYYPAPYGVYQQLYILTALNSVTPGAANLPLVIRRNSNTVAAGVGIGFSASTNANDIGAKVVYIRQGGASVGDLVFYTQSSGTGDSTTERMRIKYDGTIAIGSTLTGMARLVVNDNSKANTIYAYSDNATGPLNSAIYGDHTTSGTGVRAASSTGYGIYASSSDPGYAGWFVGRVGTNLGVHPGVSTKHLYDIAELIPCTVDVEYGDVVVINPDKDREVIKCTKENESTAGIISENPQFCFGDREKARELEPEKNWNFLALAGQVYCKVDASYGGINRGDLLTTSPTPGHAMKADNPKIGTIVGKALEPHKDGKGKILVLVSPM